MRLLAITLMVALVGCVDRDGGDDAGEGSGSGSGTTSASSSASGSSSVSASGSASGSGSGSATSSSDSSSTTAMETGSSCASEPEPNPEYICCDGAWIDPRSNQFNCGDCGNACSGSTPFCDQGTCAATPCSAESCGEGMECCGGACCEPGAVCCTTNGPIEAGPGCVILDEDNTCPAGCAPLCQCAAPQTPIATPDGERPIAALASGDLVYSIDDGAIVAVPVARVQRVAVVDHRVARVVLDDGRVLRITPSHPLASGRPFGELTIGQRLGDAAIVEVAIVSYDEPFTHDILPMSSTATYFVAGEAIASTMR